MAENKRQFGALELAILQIFKTAKGRLTVRDVLESMGGEDKYTSIMTVMNRMVEKGLLQRERVGQQYEYWLLKATMRPSFLEQLKQNVFGGKSASMVSYLLEESDDISTEELDEMEKLIKRLKGEKR